MTLRR